MILLINPKTTKPTEVQTEYFREPNLGILYLAAILDQHEYDVNILDLEQFSGINQNQLEKLIIEKIKNVKIVGITSLTNTFDLALEIVRIIKNYKREKYVVLGGPHVSFLYEEILKSNPEINFICVGESETTFFYLVEIIKRVIENHNQIKIYEPKLEEIKGLAFLNSKNELVFTGFPDPIDIDKIPLPARYKLENKNYYYRVANIIINRGCPNQCSFCSRQNLFRKVRIRSIDSVFTEIRDILSYQNYDYINFYDNINIDNLFFNEFCRIFIDNKIQIAWGCELRVDTITEKDAKLLKKAGCRLVATGIESASIDVLKKNFKYQNPQKVVEGVRNLKKYDIPIQAYFVLGLPGETKKTFYNTISYIKNMPFSEDDKIDYFVATPYPGSRLWEEQDSFEIKIIEKDFNKYDCQHIIFETKNLNKLELLELYKFAKEIEMEFQI